jgi:hypothetical protein
VPPVYATICSIGGNGARSCTFLTDEPVPPGTLCHCGQYNGVVPWTIACVSEYFGDAHCRFLSDEPLSSGLRCHCGFYEGVTE